MSVLTEHLKHEHSNLLPHIESLRIAADAVGEVPVPILCELTEEALAFLVRELIPHAEIESKILYRAVDRALGADDATATMRRDHVEVGRYAEELSTLHGAVLAANDLSDEHARDLRRVLYGLYAVLILHFAKEEEVYAPVLAARLDPLEAQRVADQLNGHD